MAKLTAKTRGSLSSKTFVFPKTRSYPLPDASHGRAALSMVAAHGSSSQKAKVRAAVHRKFPEIGRKSSRKSESSRSSRRG